MLKKYLLSVLDKKINYKDKVISDDKGNKKPSFKNVAKNFFKLNQTNISLTRSNKELNVSSDHETLRNHDNNDETPISHYFGNDKYGSSPFNNNDLSKNKIEKIISKTEYESIIK